MSVMSSRPPRPTTVWRSRAGLISTPSTACRPITRSRTSYVRFVDRFPRPARPEVVANCSVDVGSGKIIAVWHWLLQLDWPAKGVVLALVLGIANLVLGIYNAWHARGADKRAAARERTAWVTDRIGDRHAELRPLLRTQLTALKCALTACEATAEAIKADQHDFRCPPSPFPDDALKETVAALDEMRLRLEHWQPQLVEAAVSRLKSLESSIARFDESFLGGNVREGSMSCQLRGLGGGRLRDRSLIQDTRHGRPSRRRSVMR